MPRSRNPGSVQTIFFLLVWFSFFVLFLVLFFPCHKGGPRPPGTHKKKVGGPGLACGWPEVAGGGRVDEGSELFFFPFRNTAEGLIIGFAVFWFAVGGRSFVPISSPFPPQADFPTSQRLAAAFLLEVSGFGLIPKISAGIFSFASFICVTRWLV